MPPSELIFEAEDSGGGAPDLLPRNWLMNRSNRYSTVLGCTWGSRVPQEARQQRENLHSTPLLYVFRESPFWDVTQTLYHIHREHSLFKLRQ